MKLFIKIFFTSTTLFITFLFFNLANGSIDCCRTSGITNKNTSSQFIFDEEAEIIQQPSYLSGTFVFNDNFPLNSDVTLAKDINLITNDNKIVGNSYSILLDRDLILNDNEILYLTDNTIINGQGHNILLGHRAQILVDSTSTLTLRNLTLKNTLNTISQPAIRCLDWHSKLALDNVELALNDDFSFYSGQLFIHNDVIFSGTSEFIYQGVRPSYITPHSKLYFDKSTSFKYYPSSSDKTLIKMQDESSDIYFDGCSLKSTFTGLQLTTGNVYFDNKVNVTSAAALDIKDLNSVNTTAVIAQTIDVAWTPNGRYLAVGNFTLLSPSTSRLYRLDNEALTLVDSIERNVTSFAWTPNGKYLAIGGAGLNRLYRLDNETLTLVDTTSESNPTFSIAWTPDGKYLVVSSFSQENRLYRLEGETLTSVGTTSESEDTYSVAWTPDGKYLAVGNFGQPNRLYRLDGETLTSVGTTSESEETYSVAWTPDGKYLAVGNLGEPNRLYRLDGETLTSVGTTSESEETRSVAWSPDSKYLAVGNFGQPNRLYRLDGETLISVGTTSESEETTSAAWTPDGKYLAVGNLGVNRLYKAIFGPSSQTQAPSNSIVFQDLQNGIESDASIHVLGGTRVILDGLMHL